MWEVYQRKPSDESAPIDDQLVLDHLQREKGRFKAVSAQGMEVRVFLTRGNPLMIGERLQTDCGKQLAIMGAEESVITARTHDWALFSKACYHLGNRHVKLQLGERWLRIVADHVLADLLVQLGLEIDHEQAVFNPEPGAYSLRGAHDHQH